MITPDTPRSYRKVAIFGLFAASVVALCLPGRIEGPEALAALSTGFTAAMGLNVWEHRRETARRVLASPRPAPAPTEAQDDAVPPVTLADLQRLAALGVSMPDLQQALALVRRRPQCGA